MVVCCGALAIAACTIALVFFLVIEKIIDLLGDSDVGSFNTDDVGHGAIIFELFELVHVLTPFRFNSFCLKANGGQNEAPAAPSCS